MNKYDWIIPYETFICYYIHDWTFLYNQEDTVNINIGVFNTPEYLIQCKKCGMHGIVRYFYIFCVSKLNSYLNCNDFLIKNIIE